MEEKVNIDLVRERSEQGDGEVEKIEGNSGILGYKVYLGQRPDGKSGLRWLVFLTEKDRQTDALRTFDATRYSGWPDGAQVMVLESEKIWNGGQFMGRKYELFLPKEEDFSLALEKLLC